MDAKESSVFRPRQVSEDHHPHACTDGLVFLTYTVFDEAVGEEVERLEVVPCRRCADSRYPRSCVAKPDCADLRREWGTPPESPPCPSRLMSKHMAAGISMSLKDTTMDINNV